MKAVLPALATLAAVILRMVEALGDPHGKVAGRAELHILQLVRDSGR